MKKVNKIVLLSLMVMFVLFATTNTTYAQDYYVSTNGNNNNDGSQTEPFRTIVHGTSELSAGDTLYINTGTYKYERIKLRQSGTASQPINIIGLGNVIMLSDNHGHAFNLLDVEHINFENIEIFHYDQGIYTARSNHININNCHLHYFKTTAVTVYDGHDWKITNCNIHDTAWNTIQILAKYNDVYNILIDNNKIHGNPGITDFDKSHGGIDLFNANYDNPDYGLVHDITITNNEIYDIEMPGIFTHGDDDYFMENMVLECNEIYNTMGVETMHFKNSLIKNNYIHDQNVWGFYTYADDGKPAMINTQIIGNVVHSCDYLRSNRALGDNTWIGGSIPDFIHWTGTLNIVDNGRKTFDVRTSSDVYIRYTDCRDFTINGQPATIKSDYSEYFINGDGNHKLFNVVNPGGSNIIVVPDCSNNSIPTPTVTPTLEPTHTETPPTHTQSDNRLKQSTPSTILGSSPWLDVGKLGDNNYNSVLWFDVPNKTVESASLSLFWYYESRDTNTEVEVYRPAAWNPLYTTWNSYDDGLNWLNPGGDCFEKYDTITLTGSPDNKYHEFDVTTLVNKYIDETYDNTGFLIKANDNDNDGYVAFYSMDHPNVNQRPKLEFTYTPDPTPTPTETATPDPTPTEPPEHPRHDVNKDGIVDMLDLDIVASHYGKNIN